MLIHIYKHATTKCTIMLLQVDSDWKSGSYQEAHDAAHNARNMGISGILIGVVSTSILVTVLVTFPLVFQPTASNGTNY